jgi:ubiquinone/menaquinone biosynthesis C-methylase UbiE
MGGSVVGLEREQRFVTMARSEIARRGMNNVEIVHGDALNTGLPKAEFDLVHERLVMFNVPTREVPLREMISLLRPGGTIALEDVVPACPCIFHGLSCSTPFTLHSMRKAEMLTSAETSSGIYVARGLRIFCSKSMWVPSIQENTDAPTCCR